MTITETHDAPAPARKKRRKAARRRAAAPKAPAGSKYEGLTLKDCCNACNVDGCVISGKPYCAHPRKGGLHSAEMNDHDALIRRKEAENILGKFKLQVE
jgi:hypothetical protein